MLGEGKELADCDEVNAQARDEVYYIFLETICECKLSNFSLFHSRELCFKFNIYRLITSQFELNLGELMKLFD